MCVCVWFAACRTASPPPCPVFKSKPLLCLLIFYKSSQSKASPLLRSRRCSLMWQPLHAQHTHARSKKKMQHITAQHNSTKRAAGAPQRSSQKGRRSISWSAFAFLLGAADFSIPWSLWRMNTKKKTRLWCGEGTQVSITSPETGWRAEGGTAQRWRGRNRDLDLTHWYCQLR